MSECYVIFGVLALLAVFGLFFAKVQFVRVQKGQKMGFLNRFVHLN